MTSEPAHSRIQVPPLAHVTLAQLPSLADDGIEECVGQVLRRIDQPGLAISGYSGASSLSGDAAADLTRPWS